MLTPKMSIRRNNVIKTYETLIEHVYEGKAGFKVQYNTILLLY